VCSARRVLLRRQTRTGEPFVESKLVPTLADLVVEILQV
jgi:hypothetical protein